jgi:uncharacterized protein (DUF849 family)
LFREVVDRVRSSGVDVVFNLTCGLGAFLFPDPDDESRVLPESEVLPVAERVRPLEDCLPEIAVNIKPELEYLAPATSALVRLSSPKAWSTARLSSRWISVRFGERPQPSKRSSTKNR